MSALCLQGCQGPAGLPCKHSGLRRNQRCSFAWHNTDIRPSHKPRFLLAFLSLERLVWDQPRGLRSSPAGANGLCSGCMAAHFCMQGFFSPSLLFARVGKELPVCACARGGAAHVCATQLSLAPSPEGKRVLAGTEGQQKDISIILCHLRGARLLSESQRSAMKQ